MGTSLEEFARELKTFRDRKTVLKALRVAVRRPFPAVRARIRKSATDSLPRRGGLNQWVAASRIGLVVRASSPRSAGVVVRGGRNSRGARSDLTGIDMGMVRAPSWGRRTRASWHAVAVAPGFFTRPVVESEEWRAEVDAGVDAAFETLRRG